MRAAGRKEHPLSMRLAEADIAIIDRAAGLRGRSRTDFVREAAVRAAEEVLIERTLIRMSPKALPPSATPSRRRRPPFWRWSSCCDARHPGRRRPRADERGWRSPRRSSSPPATMSRPSLAASRHSTTG